MNCYCNAFEEINEFRSPNEFKRFQDYIGDFVDDGKLVEIPVREKYAGFPEQWYKCKVCALTWRLVYPDFPYKGEWSVVRYEKVYEKLLLDFKNCQFPKEDLCNQFEVDDLTQATIETPAMISTSDVIAVLTAYSKNEIMLEQLLDWVNVIWFTDLFDYDEDQSDSIASVLSILEELDEDDNELTKSDIDACIEALENNQEVWICEEI